MSILLNEVYKLEIVSYTHDGLGVGKVNNFPIFVLNAILGEVVEVKVTKVKKNLAFAEIIKIVNVSPFRVVPKCSVYEKCGGCKTQHMSYEAELDFKTLKVKSTITKFLKEDIFVNNTFASPLVEGYRNKVQIPIGYDLNKNVVSGFYESGTHNIISTNYCLLQSDNVNAVIEYCKKLLQEYNIPIYNEKLNAGTVRHIMIRENNKHEIMLVFITKTKEFIKNGDFIDNIIRSLPNIKTIIQNINSEVTNVILGKENKTLFGNGYFYDYIGDLKFKISPHSFFQVNGTQTKNLYDIVKEYANVNNTDILIDAYCGVGSIGLYIGKNAKKLYGIEIVDKAIKDAIENAKANNINNTAFITGKTEDELPKLLEKGIIPNVLIVDPPRKGCTPSLIHAIAKSNIWRVVYVSCDVATLARDLVLFKELNYEIKNISPIDMFPRTFHIETVVLLEKN